MSEALFLPRELFNAGDPANQKSVPAVAPSEAVLGELERFNRQGPSFNGRYSRRLKPRDPHAPKVDLWLDLVS